MLKISVTVSGLYATNTYLIIDEKTGEAAVIDPAVADDALFSALRENGVSELKYILLTHGHFDHICGVYPLKEKLGGKVLIHSEDADCLRDSRVSLTQSVKGYTQTEMEPDGELSDGDTVILGETKISVMHTPGHTRGSIMLIADGYIFSGDTLFRCSMGRTDLPGGSTKTLFASLRAIGKMEGEYDIFPGHGEKTTLSYEKANNRYLRANGTSHN